VQIAQLFTRKTPPVVGLDISSSAVKLLELSRNGNRYRVESYAVEPLPPNSVVEKNITDVEAVGEAIRRAVKRSGTRTRHAAVSVAGSAVITRTITMSAGLSEDDMESQIQFEAEGGPVKAQLFIPTRTEPYQVVDQSFVSPGYGVTTELQRGRGMHAVYSIQDAKGPQTLYYRAVVQRGRESADAERDPRLRAAAEAGGRRAVQRAVAGLHARAPEPTATISISIRMMSSVRARARTGLSFMAYSIRPATRRVSMVGSTTCSMAQGFARSITAWRKRLAAPIWRN